MNIKALAALNLALAIAVGAFGAHALAETLTANSSTETYHTATLYHLACGLGALVIALFADQMAKPKLANRSAIFMLVGCVLFSGSLYALSLSGIRIFGAITPLGGVCFIGSWVAFAFSTVSKANSK